MIILKNLLLQAVYYSIKLTWMLHPTIPFTYNFKFKLMTDKLVERVKVAVRLRPLIEEELISKDRSICIEQIDPVKKIIVSMHLNLIFSQKGF